MDAIELTLFVKRINAICGEMGEVLIRTAFSPNIRDRLDFSCAVFNAEGELCAQAAHIPVHLGSMAYAMQSIVSRITWLPGDIIILNDPYLGGTHLPDITFIAPVIHRDTLLGFVANRAHHADIGSDTPGSMPLCTTLQQEGAIIPPTRIMKSGELVITEIDNLLSRLHQPQKARPDFIAQISANKTGLGRLDKLINLMSAKNFSAGLNQMNDYAEKLAHSSLKNLAPGQYRFSDYMDDDGQHNYDIRISVTINISDNHIEVDFDGTDKQVTGNINCPLSVTAAAVYYCFYSLMPPDTPACAGALRNIKINAPAGTLVNAEYPAAVAAGNVETSTRIVDVLLGALAQAIPDKIPAASHGSMNNIAMGNRNWDYYETLGGGMGANRKSDGLDAVQTHMTNTLNTPIEILENHYPLRVTRYAVRNDSGGAGLHRGGNGLIREYEFLEDCQVTLLTERRTRRAWGSNGGQPGLPGKNCLNGQVIPGKTSLDVASGDILTIETGGGGGWGRPTCQTPP